MKLIIVVAIALLITPLALFAVEFRAEFRSLETLYQSGNLKELGARLMDANLDNARIKGANLENVNLPVRYRLSAWFKKKQ